MRFVEESDASGAGMTWYNEGGATRSMLFSLPLCSFRCGHDVI